MPANNRRSARSAQTAGHAVFAKDRCLAIITGCSWLGAELAVRLDSAGYAVIVIDNQQEALDRIDRSFGGIVLQADSTDPAVLEHCRVREAGLLLSLYIDDALNLLIGKMAESIYVVPDVRILLLDGSHRASMVGSRIKVISPPEMLSTAMMIDLKQMEADC